MDHLTLNSYLDFYFLQAMLTEPPDGFNKASELLLTDLQEMNKVLVDKFSKVILQYTFVASCGEARHGYHGPGKIIPELPIGGARSSACKAAMKYAPNENNFVILSKLFNLGWHGGFGGPKWANIAESGTMYATGKLDTVSFVDHCADLEHNGGCYFNKSSAGEECKFYLQWGAGGGFKSFLNVKTSAPSMLDYKWDKLYSGKLLFGSEVATLVHRYFVVVKKQEPPIWLKSKFPTNYAAFQPAEMGDGQFSAIVKYNAQTHGSKMQQAQAIEMAEHYEKAYANQYSSGVDIYDKDVETVGQSRSKDDKAKEYWDEQSKPSEGKPVEGEPVPQRKYTSIPIG